MKKSQTAAPTPRHDSVLRQTGNYIPTFLVPKLARSTEGDKQTLRLVDFLGQSGNAVRWQV